MVCCLFVYICSGLFVNEALRFEEEWQIKQFMDRR